MYYIPSINLYIYMYISTSLISGASQLSQMASSPNGKRALSFVLI